MHLDKWESQVRKGVLEFILLLTISEKECYGFEMITEITKKISLDISEGTIYPLLGRLEREGLISSDWKQEGSGVPRKYYKVTAQGSDNLKSMKQYWLNLNYSIQKLMV